MAELMADSAISSQYSASLRQLPATVLAALTESGDIPAMLNTASARFPRLLARRTHSSAASISPSIHALTASPNSGAISAPNFIMALRTSTSEAVPCRSLMHPATRTAWSPILSMLLLTKTHPVTCRRFSPIREHSETSIWWMLDCLWISQWMRSTSMSRSAMAAILSKSPSSAVRNTSETILFTRRCSRRTFFCGWISVWSMRSLITIQDSSSSTISMPMKVCVNLEAGSSIPPRMGCFENTVIGLCPAM